MSQKTNIQWCDSTINPVMGCSGCDLFPAPSEVVSSINDAAAALGVTLDSGRLLKSMIAQGHTLIASPGVGHRDALTTTNIYHYRDHLDRVVTDLHGRAAGRAAVEAIKSSVPATQPSSTSTGALASSIRGARPRRATRPSSSN